jgi:hypothetical protein
MVEGGGFEPPKSSDDRFTVCSLWPLGNPSKEDKASLLLGGAGDGTRTRNLLITSQLLCQLSYASASINIYLTFIAWSSIFQKKAEAHFINDFAEGVKIYLQSNVSAET